MNELQITLLILAVIFVSGLYFLGKRRRQSRQDASVAETAKRPEAAEERPAQANSPQRDLFEQDAVSDEADRIFEENGRLVIEVDDVGVPDADVVETRTNFGRPADTDAGSQTEAVVGKSATVREPQIFAILIIGGQTYDARTIRHALLAQGMVYDDREQIFVMRDEEGRTYLRAANVLHPGLLPDQDDAEFETPGVALILQLPTCIPAPAAMDDMIHVARKLTQRLGAHMYQMDREHMTESDLRAMRRAALDYVSEPLKR